MQMIGRGCLIRQSSIAHSSLFQLILNGSQVIVELQSKRQFAFVCPEAIYIVQTEIDHFHDLMCIQPQSDACLWAQLELSCTDAVITGDEVSYSFIIQRFAYHSLIAGC